MNEPTEAMRPMGLGETIDNVQLANERARALMNAFVHFPTAHNLDVTVAAMRDFQTAWMHRAAALSDRNSST